MDNEGMENLKEIEGLEEQVKEDYGYNTAYHTRRIADTLEAILQLIKKDLEESKKRWPYPEKESE
tara:strand:- start:74 stop:268 length:195 start_codon:yes stop_codon:yes gene_type:complete